MKTYAGVAGDTRMLSLRECEQVLKLGLEICGDNAGKLLAGNPCGT